MNLFDIIVSAVAFILLPVFIYFIYVVYKRIYNEKENGLIFVVMLYSILYIEYKYGVTINKGMPLLLLNIPLIISMKEKKITHTIIISLILVMYYYFYFNDFLLIIVLEYLLYFMLRNSKNILIYFCLIKMFLSFFYFENINILLEVIFFYFMCLFVIYIIERGKEMFEIFLSLKKLKQNKQIQNALFKISHEIKNPIAVCKGYLDMFDPDNKNHSKEYIPIIKEEIERTLILLEDFLALNKNKIKKEIIDINFLLEELIKNYKPIFKKNNINLSFNLPDDEIYINGDYNRLMQVFINILKNSIEAKDDSKKMNVNIELKEENDDIYLNFYDNGIGINKKNLEKIKTPFFTTKTLGSGLGASLSSEIIDAHFGSLDYESKEGEYTLVKIKLPKLT